MKTYGLSDPRIPNQYQRAAMIREGWKPCEIDLTAPNPRVATRYALDGGTARLYANGMVDAVDGEYYSISPGFDSFGELQAWIGRKCRF